VANNLVVGENVIAAEVHQASATSSDSVFGAELAAVTSIPPQPEIKSRDPAPDALNVPLDANIRIVVSDGAAQVQVDSVQLTSNEGRDHYDGPFLLVLDNLVVGENVIAAELHQTTADSSDSVFGAELAVVTSTPQASEGPVFLPPNIAATGEITFDWNNSAGNEILQESDDLINWNVVTSQAKPFVLTPDVTGRKFYQLMRQ
jgi:hypothetical protein